ncbi:8-amino-7-oxononanoate synthase [Flexivirga endophytica]|uniref:8-amino-7-oxononanoate synthase n=1 Tax=Flexivirga endophytica TaxID=1849103 RepID=A0A916TC02_9MICO|nr:8-amino-7-oxononanoate synthase [Flexivirga endophytica]GGB39125.1 8-amino-7-oxononanoate synthase [Flexivirga endophytica]GHB47101.1 8-amino-7-oxononanoate synthase [Flexivirga endophytica]
MTWSSWLADRAALRQERGVERTDPVVRSHTMIDLASNDYLGLSRDPRIIAAAVAATERYGAGAAASRLVTGTLPIHRELESALGDLTDWPAALVFSTGYAANLGVVSSLAGRGAHVLLDAHAHASLHDAARMSRSPYVLFAHNDVADLDARLRELDGVRVLVAVESIYSVLGDAAPLPELYAVCRSHGALLLVDEAHGIGVAGDGRGLVHGLGLAGQPDLVVTATLSKSLGAQGGAVLSSASVRNHLVNTARSFIFDTGLAPAAAGAAREAVRLIGEQPELAAAVHLRASVIAERCGISPAAGAVQSLPMPGPLEAVAARDELRAAGVLVGCFRPPSVPDEISRLRITARADLTLDVVDSAAERVGKVARRTERVPT